MKYIILSKDLNKGKVGDDSGNLSRYFELGWECIGSRFDFIAMYNRGEIQEDNVTIVTIEDRMFFYTKFYKNVISYDQFLQLLNKGIITKEDIIDDWTINHKNLKFLNGKTFVNPENKKYYRYEEDRHLIFDGFDLSGSISPNCEFVVMCIRYRDWSSNRNSNINFYQNLVDKIKDKYQIFVVGKGNEDFCTRNSINYVDKLKDYVALIKNKNCKGLICQSTGTAVLAFNCAEVDIHLIDHSRASEIHGINAVLGGTTSQFCSKKIIPYYNYNQETFNSIIKGILNV